MTCPLFEHRLFKCTEVMKDFSKAWETNEMTPYDLWIPEQTAIREKADGEI